VGGRRAQRQPGEKGLSAWKGYPKNGGIEVKRDDKQTKPVEWEKGKNGIVAETLMLMGIHETASPYRVKKTFTKLPHGADWLFGD